MKEKCEYCGNTLKEVHSAKIKSGMQKAKASGLSIGRPSRLHEKTRQVLNLRDEGDSYRTIAFKLGLSLGMVGRILKRVNTRPKDI